MPAKKDETASKEKSETAKPKKSIKKKTVQNAEVPKRLQTDTKSRKRTLVERYTEVPAASKSTEKEIKIPKGKGKKLEDCDNIVTQLNKRKRSDTALKAFHSIVFGGRITKQTPIKKNILAFSGVVYDDEKKREDLEARIANHNYQEIKEVLIFLGQDPSGTKEEVVDKLANFLEKPAPSDEDFTPKKRKRSASRSKSPSSKKRKSKKSKKEKDPNAPKRPLSSYMLFCKEHRKQVTKDNPKEPLTEIAKILGKMWNKADAKEKKKFEKKSEEAKEQYAKEMKKYTGKSPKASKKSEKSPKSPKKSAKSPKSPKKGKKESAGSSSESS